MLLFVGLENKNFTKKIIPLCKRGFIISIFNQRLIKYSTLSYCQRNFLSKMTNKFE